MRNTVSGERKETEFRNDCDKIGKSTNYRYKKQYIDIKGNHRKAGIFSIENSLAFNNETSVTC